MLWGTDTIQYYILINQEMFFLFYGVIAENAAVIIAENYPSILRITLLTINLKSLAEITFVVKGYYPGSSKGGDQRSLSTLTLR